MDCKAAPSISRSGCGWRRIKAQVAPPLPPTGGMQPRGRGPRNAVRELGADRLVKIGARIVRHGRSIAFPMAEVMVARALFGQILVAIACCAHYRRLPDVESRWPRQSRRLTVSGELRPGRTRRRPSFGPTATIGRSDPTRMRSGRHQRRQSRRISNMLIDGWQVRPTIREISVYEVVGRL